MDLAEKDIQLFKTILEQTPISTQIFTPDGETLMVNKAWEKLWNVTFKQVKSYNILKDQQLAAFEIKERFYEVGSFTGIAALEDYLLGVVE